MKKIKSIYRLPIMAMLLTAVISCKKSETAAVIKKDVVITWTNPADITEGTALGTTQLNGTASTAGTFVYTPASGTVLSAGTSQNLKVDFKPTDAVNYNTATKTVRINVVPLTVSDIDGNLYHTVVIGTQTWTVENLKVAKYRNGDAIPEVTGVAAWSALATGAWCNYNNDAANGTTYGKLYNWFAVTDPRGLAPAGWHIPSKDEWKTLSDYLGGGLNGGGLTNCPYKLKNTTGWDVNTGSTNSSGFTALPNGSRDVDGTSYWIGYMGSWHSSTEATGTGGVWEYQIFSDQEYYTLAPDGERVGNAVRCVKD